MLIVYAGFQIKCRSIKNEYFPYNQIEGISVTELVKGGITHYDEHESNMAVW